MCVVNFFYWPNCITTIIVACKFILNLSKDTLHRLVILLNIYEEFYNRNSMQYEVANTTSHQGNLE